MLALPIGGDVFRDEELVAFDDPVSGSGGGLSLELRKAPAMQLVMYGRLCWFWRVGDPIHCCGLRKSVLGRISGGFRRVGRMS